MANLPGFRPIIGSSPKAIKALQTKHLVPQCKVILHQWEKIEFRSLEDDASDADLSASTRWDISSKVLSCTFSKNLGAASGSFSISLANTPNTPDDAIDTFDNWFDFIKQGSWIVIYMSNDGSLDLSPTTKKVRGFRSEQKFIRCIGYVDRVVGNSVIDDRGSTSITYEVIGRDFGVIYEDSTIWHNFFFVEKMILDTVAQQDLTVVGTITQDKALQTIHDLVYFPGRIEGVHPNDNKSLFSIGLQWLLPKTLILDVLTDTFGFKSPFWGNMDGITNFEPTTTRLSIVSPTDYLSGNTWSMLKRLSVPQLHELFTETTDAGNPQLTFRPMPFKINGEKYPITGALIKAFKDLPNVNIDKIDVKDCTISKDNQNRYNSFLLTISTSLVNREDNIALLTDPPKLTGEYPKNISNSIRRHGFRPMHTTVNTLVLNPALGNGIGDSILLKEFNAVMEDYWRPLHTMSSGTINIIGNNKIKIGKTVTFEDTTQFLEGKKFYIEGYTDSFSIGERGEGVWNTSLFVTRGINIVELTHKQPTETEPNSGEIRGEVTAARRKK